MTEILLGILIVLQIADYWTTMQVLQQGGHENNPVVTWLMQRLGVTVGLALGKVFAAGVAVMIYYLGGDYAAIMLGAVCVFYAWIVMQNYGQIK